MDSSTEKKNKLDIFYEKSPSYHAYPVGGVYGGITRSGIHFDIFTERPALPIKTTVGLNDDGNLGDILDMEFKEDGPGICRDLQCGLYMNIDTATSLYNWLGDKIQKFNELAKSQENDEK